MRFRPARQVTIPALVVSVGAIGSAFEFSRHLGTGQVREATFQPAAPDVPTSTSVAAPALLIPAAGLPPASKSSIEPTSGGNAVISAPVATEMQHAELRLKTATTAITGENASLGMNDTGPRPPVVSPAGP